MRTIPIVTLFVLTLGVLQSIVVAQPPLQKTVHLMLRETVDACVVVVRKEFEAHYAPLMKTNFSAYSKFDGTVSLFGSKEDNFNFKKCMYDRGYPMK
jgi:hypothetical protein